MSPEHLVALIIEYRYWILIPLSLLEGPIVAVIAGTLAAGGYFELLVLEIVFVTRDVVMDLLYYTLGLFAGKSKFVARLLQKVGINAEHLKKAERLWHVHPLRTMALSKISYGIAPSFFVVAGMVRMRISRFTGYNALIAMFMYAFFLGIGYYFGNSFGDRVNHILHNLQYIILGIVLGFVALHFIQLFFRKRLLREAESAEEKSIGKPDLPLSE